MKSNFVLCILATFWRLVKRTKTCSFSHLLPQTTLPLHLHVVAGNAIRPPPHSDSAGWQPTFVSAGRPFEADPVHSDPINLSSRITGTSVTRQSTSDGSCCGASSFPFTPDSYDSPLTLVCSSRVRTNVSSTRPNSCQPHGTSAPSAPLGPHVSVCQMTPAADRRGPLIAHCHLCLVELRDTKSLKMLRSDPVPEQPGLPYFPFLTR
ncbi:unnamed protein product [Protopolystoma xenopodis]|uniref:Secreted protein n=1 Tax=Protopolystoma xenopodis TaxID=117903 RepID=A0A448WQ78_9PLAT|nr:unnamed protein product [Protopolystoma xenopodis]